MLRLYNLDPSALFFKYEAFVMSRPSGLRAKLSVLTLETARELKKEIQREHQAKAVSVAAGSHTHTETPKAGVGMRKGKGNMADLGGLYVYLLLRWRELIVVWTDYPLLFESRAVYLLDSPMGLQYLQLDLLSVPLPRTIRHPRT
jgi:hypothetical protein